MNIIGEVIETEKSNAAIISIPLNLYTEIEEYCEKKGIEKSAFIKEAIQNLLNKR